MPLGEFSIICFEFLGDFWRKLQKGAKKENLAKIGPLRRSEGHLRSGVVLHRNEGLLCRGEAESQRGHPTGSLQRGHCSQRQNFLILFPKVQYSCTDSLGILINYQWGFK